jgi:hypothetical protein
MPAPQPDGGEKVTSARQGRVAGAVLLVTVGLEVLWLVLLPAQEWRLTTRFVARWLVMDCSFLPAQRSGS